MSTTVTLSRDYFAIVQSYPTPNEYNNHTSSSASCTSSKCYEILIHYKAPADEYKRKKILSGEFKASASISGPGGVGSGTIEYRYLFSGFSNTVIYADIPLKASFGKDIINTLGSGTTTQTLSYPSATRILKYGANIGMYAGRPSSGTTVSISTNATVNIVFSDEEVKLRETVSSMSPTAGSSLNTALPQTFKTGIDFDSKYAYEMPTLTAKKVKIRLKGAETWTEYNLDESGKVVIAGNLLPVGTIEYCFETTTDVETLTTSIYEATTYHSITTGTTPVASTVIAKDTSQEFNLNPLSGVSSIAFRYRKSGEEQYTEIAIAPATTYTLVLSTLDSFNYEYQFTGADQYSVTAETPWTTFTTRDRMNPICVPASPNGEAVYFTKPVTFKWHYVTASTLPQTKADLQISTDGETWTDLITVEGSATTVDVELPHVTQEYYWRGRVYNYDGVSGDWSGKVPRFTTIGEPDVPIVVAEDLDLRPTIDWQTAEQVAAEIQFDGETYAVWGAGTKTWKCPHYMKPTSTTVYVRVQNNLGLWSGWASLDIIVNGKVGAISLAGKNDNGAAKLEWSISDNDFYLVYRNGEPIAKTTETKYTDYFSAGNTSYYIIGGNYSDDNYSISEEITVNVIPKSEILVDIDALKTISLEITDEQDRRTQTTQNITSATYTLSGKIKPTVETNGALTKTVSLTAAFENADDEKTLLDCIGKTVCLKTTKGRMAIGVLTALPIYDEQFYSVYTISVTDSDFQEVIDIDTGMPI